MSTAVTSSVLLFVGLLVSAVFIPADYQIFADAQFSSGVTCPSTINPVGIPSDVSQLWGTWYTIASPASVTNTSLICPQVAYQPDNPSSLTTNLAYLGSLNINVPTGENYIAQGTMTAVNPTANNPAYVLTLFGVAANFWFIATDGGDSSGNNPTALITLSCDQVDNQNAQLFFLSRQPSFVDSVSYNSLMAKAKTAINNFDDFDLIPNTQVNNWCYYPFASTNVATSTDDDDDNLKNDNLVVSSIAAAFAIVCFMFLVGLTIFLCLRMKAGSGDSSFSMNPMSKRNEV